MEQNQCIQCEQYKKEIQEKEDKIKILENNILKIKSLLSESGSLIDGYNEIMEENKNLKSEIEKLKNDINLYNNNNYQFEMLKQKIIRYQQENQELKATKQFYESQKSQSVKNKDSNETKIKRELCQKDKEINQLNTIISLIKLHNNDEHLSNEEIIKKYSKNKINNNNNSIIDEDEMLFFDNDNNNNNLEQKNNIYNNNIYNHEIDYPDNNFYNFKNNNVKMIDLYKEKEFLSEEYQKYKQKYIIYKFKYHEFKKTTKLFLNYMKVIPHGGNISNIFENMNEKKTLNLIGSKRLKSNNEKDEIKTSDYLYNNINAIRNVKINNQIRKKSEDTFKDIYKIPSLFNNTFNENEENYSGEADIKIVETEEEKNTKNKSGKKKKNEKKKRGRKKTIKIKELDEEESEKSDISKSDEEKVKEKKEIAKDKEKNKEKEKEKDNKTKNEPKKRGRKPKKKKKKKKKNKNGVEKVIMDSEEDENKDNDKENIGENKNEKKNIIKDSNDKDEKEENEKEKENKEKKDEKNEEKNEEKENNKEKEKEKENIKEKEKENKIKEEHIGPVPKNIKKKIDPIAQKTLNINNLLNLLSNTPDRITEENLNSILCLHNTINEKISFLFEIIISNLIKLELSRVLTLFETFLDINQESKNIIGINILENINMNLNTNSLLSKKIHLKIANKTNDTYKNYINKNHSQPIYLISFLIDILYRKLIDISCISHFIFQLVFDKNIDDKNKNSILIILIDTIKEEKEKQENNSKLFYKEEQLNKFLSPENEYKFYFFISYKNNLISVNIINLILSIYDKNNTNNANNINNDNEIITQFNNLFNCIPKEKELKIEIPNFMEEYKSSIKFNTDIFYLEIYQALSIIVEIKDMKWIIENIFTNILWKNFTESNKDSLKRALAIYYSSLLFYLCLKNGLKNHSNDNLLQQQEFVILYGWLYSLYNPSTEIEKKNPISFYEKLCALSWIIESPIMNMSNKVYDTIKENIDKNIKGEKESLCPSDFLDKLRKLKIL